MTATDGDNEIVQLTESSFQLGQSNCITGKGSGYLSHIGGNLILN